MYSQVICRQYLGYLPFTTILREVYGLPYPRSTQKSLRSQKHITLQLHYIVELIVLVQTYLSPGQECLRSIVQQAITNSKEGREIISPLKVQYYWIKLHC